MSIWFNELTLDTLNALGEGSAAGNLGIEFIEVGDDYLKARMPLSERTRQPAGVLHGGMSVVLAETIASCASLYTLDTDKYHMVGLEINANHMKPASEGYVYAVTKPIHIGRSTQVWEVKITREDGAMVCISRMTAAILETPSRYQGRG